MGLLNELGVVVGTDTKAASVFEEIYPDFLRVPYSKPSEYISDFWERYEQRSNTNNNQNGKIFEILLATMFIRENMLPLYISAKVAFVPNVIYDMMFYTEGIGPVCVSAKTSLRERYKQADLEAIALKYVHRRSKSYLVTLEEREAISVREKIKKGDVIGLDSVIVATTAELDVLIDEWHQMTFSTAPNVEVVESTQILTQTVVNRVINKKMKKEKRGNVR